MSGVDDQIRGRSKITKYEPLPSQAVEDAVSFLQRVRPTRRFESSDEGFLGCLEEEHLKVDSVATKVGHRLGQLREEGSAAGIDDHGDPMHVGVLHGDVDRRPDQHGWNVVDDEPSGVLESAGRGRSTRTGHTRHEKNIESLRRHRDLVMMTTLAPHARWWRP